MLTLSYSSHHILTVVQHFEHSRIQQLTFTIKLRRDLMESMRCVEFRDYTTVEDIRNIRGMLLSEPSCYESMKPRL